MRPFTWRLALPMLLAATLAPATSAAARPAPRRAARPTLRLVAQPVPMVGIGGTGNMVRAGAALDVQITVIHADRELAMPPVTELKLYLPTGLVIRGSGFPTCPPPSLLVASSCPPGSRDGPPGEALLSFPSGAPGTQEAAVAETFHGPAGGLELAVRSATTGAPLLLGLGTLETLNGAAGQGPVIDWQLSAPSASPMATLDSLHLRLGSAMRTRTPGGNPRWAYYFTLPRDEQCPLDGLHFMAVVRFAATRHVRAFTIEARYRSPCPSPRPRYRSEPAS